MLCSLIFFTGFAEADDTVQIQSVASGKCLDVPNCGNANELKIQQYSCWGSNSKYIDCQLWRLKEVKGYVQIQSVTSGKCLDVPNLSTENYVGIQQYSCWGADSKYINAQLWRLKNVKGHVQIQSVASGKCLDVPNLSSANYVGIQQYSCWGADSEYINAQLWRLDRH